MILDDKYFMKQALAEAKSAFEKNEVPIGAIIVWDNKIIARAHNLVETLKDVTAHAEMQAITAAAEMLGSKYLKECTLYVTLEPCPMCAGALKWAQIAKIVVGATDEKGGFSKISNDMLHPKTEYSTGLLKEECATLLQSFFKAKR